MTNQDEGFGVRRSPSVLDGVDAGGDSGNVSNKVNGTFIAIIQSGNEIITADIRSSVEESLIWVWSKMGNSPQIQIPSLDSILPFIQATGRFTNSITADSSFKVTIIKVETKLELP